MAPDEELQVLRILILEDMPADAQLVQQELRDADIGFRSRVVETEEEFLDALTSFRPDIILADYTLPGYDGMSVLLDSRQACPLVPVIFVSGPIGEERAIEAFRQGAGDYILKDRLSDLVPVIQNAIRMAGERAGVLDHLRQLENRYERLVNNAVDGIFQMTLEGKLLTANTALARMTGFDSAAGMIGRLDNITELFALPDDREKLLKSIDDSGALKDFELEIRRHDGGLLWVLINAHVYRDPEGKPGGLEGIWTDITARKKTEFELHKLNRLLLVLSGCNEALVRATEPEELIEKVCNMIVATGGYAAAWVESPGNGCARGSATGAAACELSGPARHNAENGAFVALPLKINKDDFGTLNVFSAMGSFEAKENKLLSELANDLSYGLSSLRQRRHRRQAEQSLNENVKKMREVINGIIQAMVITVESRDAYTSGHQQRVAQLAAAIAVDMHLSSITIEGIRIASAIHDLGKINIPSEILTKPSALMEAEMELLRAHCRVGYDILKPIDFPWPLADVVLQHHERIDGSGYPFHLVGSEILLEARILAVSDVVEAMASHRPYRPALGIDQALDEIWENRGVLYDEQVAASCVKLFREDGFRFSEPSVKADKVWL